MSRVDVTVRQEAATLAAAEPVLEVRNLTTMFPTARGAAAAVNNVSFTVRPRETKGLVGESGSGKSITLRSLLGLVPWPGQVVAGSIRWGGRELVGMSEREMRKIRGREISMIFQDPTSALNPVFTVGEQIAETLRVHEHLGAREARRGAVALLDRVGIPAAAERARAYPHQLSGGMRQRAMIAIAIACRPRLVLADEPTTNLDVTIQDQILNLLAELQAEEGMSVILVSHDLGVVAQNADSLAVMYAGSILEDGPTAELFSEPRHPYTSALIGALPRIAPARRGAPLDTIGGQPPELDSLPSGCPFAPRCRFAREECGGIALELRGPGDHRTACPFHADLVPPGSEQR